jgi:two-component system sensor histidine kinase BaeS
MMTLSLRTRLLIAITSVSAATLVVAAWVSNRVVQSEVSQVIANSQQPRDFSGAASLAQNFYDRTGNWTGVDSTLQKISELSGRRVLLISPSGQAIGIAPGSMAEQKVSVDADRKVVLERTGQRGHERNEFLNPPHTSVKDRIGNNVGMLYFLALPESASAETVVGPQPRSAIAWRLLPALSALILLSLLATLLLSRRILRPLESMKTAVHGMRAGDLSQKLEINSHDEIGELAEAFNDMAADLARVKQLRRDMVSDVAHELRTPLTNIRCQIEAMQDGLVAPQIGNLASLHDEVMLLDKLVDDLRDLALADAGQLKMEMQSISLGHAVNQVIEALGHRLANRKIALSVAIPDELPQIMADPLRLGQVLRNLFENALAHTPEGGAISVAVAARPSEVQFTIRDSGAGIPPDQLQNIFERFYRTDPSRSRDAGGAGLGLAIVQQIVTAHGGRVWAENSAGHGAKFTVAIPLPRE